MAVKTVLRYICMFIEKRASFFSVTLDAGFLDTVLQQVIISKSAMDIVAVITENSPLFERMVAWQGELGLGGLMATETEFAGGKRRYF